jgi:hypothetical protein
MTQILDLCVRAWRSFHGDGIRTLASMVCSSCRAESNRHEGIRLAPYVRSPSFGADVADAMTSVLS